MQESSVRDGQNLPAPIVVWLDPSRPEFGTRIVATVQDGLAALHRHGIEPARHGLLAPLWNAAAQALEAASRNPSSANLQAAFEALLILVKRAAPVPSRVRIRAAPRGLRDHLARLLMPPRRSSEPFAPPGPIGRS